jgi:acyl carrier protein
MSIFKIETAVKRILRENLALSTHILINHTDEIVENLGADSLDIVELTMCFEEHFEMQIPDEASKKFKTVGDIINYLDHCSKEQQEAPINIPHKLYKELVFAFNALPNTIYRGHLYEKTYELAAALRNTKT